MEPPPTPLSASRALLPVLVLIGMVTSVVSSLGAPLLPTIARTDHVSLGTAQWSLTITVLVGAITAPVLGRLGDGPGRRRVILWALAAVTVGSVVAALAGGSFALLLVGRGLHGFGLGLMPLTMVVARDALPPHGAAPAIALLSVATAAGAGLGYPVTGVLATYGGLHATFWFGAVVGAVALAASWPVIPSSRHLRRRSLDAAGAALLGLALLAVLVATTQGEQWGWESAAVLGLYAAGAVLAGRWIFQERSARNPLVDLSLLRHASVAVTNVTAMVIAMAMYILLPLVTAFVQAPPSAGYGSGSSVIVVGLMLVPFAVLSTSMSRVAAALGRRIGPERVVPIGILFLAAALGLFCVTSGSVLEGFIAMGLAGVGCGFTFAAMPGIIVRSVPSDETGSALGFYQVVRYVGFAIGSAVSASILAVFTPAGQLLPEREGFTVALAVGAVVCVVAALANAFLGRKIASSESGSSSPTRPDTGQPAPALPGAGLSGSAPSRR
jgi:predicted MFS family arabinose efflux permease